MTERSRDPFVSPGHRALLMLMGLRASGKTTLGRRLASRAGLRFIDLDDRVCASLAVNNASEAFARFGEAEFRRTESNELCHALTEHLDLRSKGESGVVLALGGGTPTATGAAELLRLACAHGGALVYLRHQPETLAKRLHAVGADANRPSLTGADPAQEVNAVFDARDDLYTKLATIVIDADQLNEQQALERLLNVLEGADPHR